MKNRLLFLSVFCLSIFTQAQNVSINTLYDDPKLNTWNVGICLAGVDIQNRSGGGIYSMVHGRYIIGKFMTVSANASYDLAKILGNGVFTTNDEVFNTLDPYLHIEGRASLHFKDKIGEMKSKIKLGRGATSKGTVKYSTNYTTKVRNVFALTGSLNIMNHTGLQIDDSASGKRVLKLEDGQGKDVGFKGNAYVNQKNMILGLGIHLGQYTHYKGVFTSGPTGKKTRWVKKSIEANFEFLLGLTLKMGDKAYWVDDDDKVVEYNITDAEKKRFGGRISVDYGSNKVGFFQHFELGYRPGLSAPSPQSSFLNQGYINWGIGFGF